MSQNSTKPEIPSSYQASPSTNSILKLAPSRRSTIVADALAKAQQANNSKLIKSLSNNKLNNLPNKPSEAMKKSSSSASVVGMAKTDTSSSVSIEMTDGRDNEEDSNDKEPFIK